MIQATDTCGHPPAEIKKKRVRVLTEEQKIKERIRSREKYAKKKKRFGIPDRKPVLTGEQRRDYYREYWRKWRVTHKKEAVAATRRWQAKNRDKVAATQRRYYASLSPEKRAKYNEQSTERKEVARAWRQKNSKRLIKYMNDWHKKRYANDPVYRVASRLRGQLTKVLIKRGYRKGAKILDQIAA